MSGIGVGMLFAALPGLIVGAVPATETGSAMSLNQVLRYIDADSRAVSGPKHLRAAPQSPGS